MKLYNKVFDDYQNKSELNLVVDMGEQVEARGRGTGVLFEVASIIVRFLINQNSEAQSGCCAELCRVQSGAPQMGADARLEADGPEWSCGQCTLCNR